MSERMESVTVQSYLDVHRNEQRDHCQCVQCRIGRDLLDARKGFAEKDAALWFLVNKFGFDPDWPMRVHESLGPRALEYRNAKNE